MTLTLSLLFCFISLFVVVVSQTELPKESSVQEEPPPRSIESSLHEAYQYFVARIGGPRNAPERIIRVLLRDLLKDQPTLQSALRAGRYALTYLPLVNYLSNVLGIAGPSLVARARIVKFVLSTDRHVPSIAEWRIQKYRDARRYQLVVIEEYFQIQKPLDYFGYIEYLRQELQNTYQKDGQIKDRYHAMALIVTIVLPRIVVELGNDVQQKGDNDDPVVIVPQDLEHYDPKQKSSQGARTSGQFVLTFLGSTIRTGGMLAFFAFLLTASGVWHEIKDRGSKCIDWAFCQLNPSNPNCSNPENKVYCFGGGATIPPEEPTTSSYYPGLSNAPFILLLVTGVVMCSCIVVGVGYHLLKLYRKGQVFSMSTFSFKTSKTKTMTTREQKKRNR